ncbi:hypothetical protein [Bradyrhizobium sp. CCBAU 53415]|uniref:hypothetical protein n=1 Tax=Bradyrhizobium sp. CCBAU 53415 TaxID=1325119 RepID=UPI0023069998|nr:hypothetical protein [Bradyrhizobium sp. CCBAU 53415]MDA9464510.1 hypothetical protein [Bradyrhizobium sp. CCBAU 53415]
MGSIRRASRFDRLDLIAILLLASLLATQMVGIGLGLIARTYVVVRADFSFDRYLEEDWMLENGQAEAAVAFKDVMPTFRRHRPAVDCNLRNLVIIVLVPGNIDTRPIFEKIETNLNNIVRSKRQIEAGVKPVKLAELSLTAYPWFKPLDILASLVLLGALLFWFFLPRKLPYHERLVSGRSKEASR